MADPVISLGGKDFPVPMLAPKQNRIVVPAISRLQGVKANAITTEQYDDFLEIAFLAAQRGTPALNKVDFMDMPVTTAELFAAFPVIIQQTGIFKRTDPEGEAQGPANSLIGIE